MAERRYPLGEAKVVLWQSELCTHCKNCFRGLPQVFDPEKRPWVNTAGATVEEIVEQVAMCPSGALSIVSGE